MHLRSLFTIILITITMSSAYGPDASFQNYAGNNLAAISPDIQEARYSERGQTNFMEIEPDYQTYHNAEDRNNEYNAGSNIRPGNIETIPATNIDAKDLRSLLSSNYRTYRVIYTEPLPPKIIRQPAKPPIYVTTGSADVIESKPIVYALKPSVVYHHEIINKIPAPINLNPVYVKVYKPDKDANEPISSDINGGTNYGSPLDISY